MSARVCKATSDPIKSPAGVPHGSHLGPIFKFVVFIIDLPTSVSSRTFLSAEDALKYEIGAPQSTTFLQRRTDHTTQWGACCHGRVSSCKTKLLPVGQQDSTDHQVTNSMDSSAISKVSSHKTSWHNNIVRPELERSCHATNKGLRMGPSLRWSF